MKETQLRTTDRHPVCPCEASSPPGQSQLHCHNQRTTMQVFDGKASINWTLIWIINFIVIVIKSGFHDWQKVTKVKLDHWNVPTVFHSAHSHRVCLWSPCGTVETPKVTTSPHSPYSCVQDRLTLWHVHAWSPSACWNSTMTTATKRRLWAPVAGQIPQKAFFFFLLESFAFSLKIKVSALQAESATNADVLPSLCCTSTSLQREIMSNDEARLQPEAAHLH